MAFLVPDVAADEQGNAHIAWQVLPVPGGFPSGYRNWQIVYLSLNPDGTVRIPLEQYIAEHPSVFPPHIYAADVALAAASGKVFLMWKSNKAGSDDVYMKIRTTV